MDSNDCPVLKSGIGPYKIECKFEDEFKNNAKGARLKAAATNSTARFPSGIRRYG
jgi:hypothetical protein